MQRVIIINYYLDPKIARWLKWTSYIAAPTSMRILASFAQMESLKVLMISLHNMLILGILQCVRSSLLISSNFASSCKSDAVITLERSS